MIRKLIEKRIKNELYRTASIGYIITLLEKKKIKTRKNFTSFTYDYIRGFSDLGFGENDILIVFNEIKLNKLNNIIEVWYEPDFMEDNPDISMHVLGYKTESEYYQDHGYDNYEEGIDNPDLLSWDAYIGTFEEEDEAVGPSLIRITTNCILRIEASRKFEKQLKYFENEYNIIYR